MQSHPVICQHAVWGSKQQRFRHCKLPAKLSPHLLDQIKSLEDQCQVAPAIADEQADASVRRHQLERYLSLRAELLQPEFDNQQVLCGHHRKEAQAAQETLDRTKREKESGTYQDPEELKRLAKEQPVDPKDIPKDFLAAVQRVFTNDPSSCVKQVLAHWNGPEDWKATRRSDAEEEIFEPRVAEQDFPCHESYTGLFAEAGVKKKRHLAQESQLIMSMATVGLLDVVTRDSSEEHAERRRRPVFVEFGAGTGGLSRHLQLVLENLVTKHDTNVQSLPITKAAVTLSATPHEPMHSEYDTIAPFSFILLDRQKFRSRNQVDYMIRTQARPVKPRLLRITKDVRDLTLQNLQLIHETQPGIARPEWTEGGGEVDPQESSTQEPTHYICISKHFCGPATDLALAWMKEQYQRQQQESHQRDRYSICFATCCHGICEPSLVVAKPYLKELFDAACARKRKRTEGHEGVEDREDQQPGGVTEQQLSAWIPWMIKLTGWATLGKQEESSLVARPGKDAPTTLRADRDDGGTLTRDQRRVLGKRCKKLLDMARSLYLIRECGFKDAKAIEYTTESVESGAIIGTM
ncbi:tRNA:m4X modification enzyme [Dissophora globulifera]|uniref:tRNA:m(4)X modification enzyme TRM13 n=1 Tax=Dissophora globulifera TaxID=979702 RepID=A0A9P6RY19_9FUNG|nr:tRNA:m4X modification enzyme [Dissophora globulifera]